MNQLINLLNRVIGNHGRKLKKTNEYMYWSPFISHHKPKLQINTETQKWHCWVSNQGGHNLFQLFKKLNATKQQYVELTDLVGSPKYRKRSKEVRSNTLRLPDEFKPLWKNGDGIIKRHALAYLKRRNVNMADIIKYGIGYCEGGLYDNRIIVPSYDSNDNLNYFVGRNIYDGGMKYKNPPTSKDIIGFDLFINWDEAIVLVEGVMDAIVVKRNVIPLFGKTVPNSLMKKIYEKKVKSIYILLDRDARKDSIEIIDKFMKNGIDVYFVDIKNGDPSDLGFEKVNELIKDTNKISFSELMKLRLNGKTKKYLETL